MSIFKQHCSQDDDKYIKVHKTLKYDKKDKIVAVLLSRQLGT